MNDKINNAIYYPMLVSQGGTTGKMSREEDASIWKTYITLSKLKQDVLTDQQISLQIIKLQEQYKLQDQSIAYISLFIRKIFFGELQMAECEAKIGGMLTTTNGGDPNQAKAIVEFIQKEILTIQPKPRTEEVSEEVSTPAKTVNMPLLQAMSKYEQLGNQLITNERIRIKSQSDPVRPSLVYWVKYYRDELGVGVHDSVQRGNFLFRSENGKRLSVEERERVNLILKSVEENYPLQIDTEKMEIVFPNFATPKKEPFTISSGAKIIKGPELGTAIENETRATPVKPVVAAPRQFTAPDPVGKKNLNPYQSGSFVISQNFQKGEALPVPEKGGMRFSSSHVFPAEKEKGAEQREVAVEQAAEILTNQASVSSAPPSSPVQTAAQVASIKPNPFRIRPVSSQSQEAVFKN